MADLEQRGGGSETDKAERRRLEERIEALKAEKATMEGALTSAREDRSRAEAELKTLRREAAAASGESDRGAQAELRKRMDELADRLMAAAEAQPAELPEAASRPEPRAAIPGRR
jgi:chromosome segregation ATPase